MLWDLIWVIVFICILWLVISNCGKISEWLSDLRSGKGEVDGGGGYNGGGYNGGGAPTRVAMDTYEMILPYTIEVGSSAHIENYLSGLLGKPTISDWVRSQGVQKPKLLELLMTGAIRTQADTANELCALLDIRYLWFVPSNKRALLLDSHKYDLGLRSELKMKIRKFAKGGGKIDHDHVNKLTDKLLIVARSYYKLKSNYVKKSLSVIRKAKDKAFELDEIGIIAPIKYLVGCVGACPTTTPKSIDDKLREIDLMVMYPKDPYAVRLFIERIQRDITNIRELPSVREGIIPLLKDLSHERELMKWETQAKRDADARKAVEREKENLQRALAESKLTAREAEIKRREKELEAAGTTPPLPPLPPPPSVIAPLGKQLESKLQKMLGEKKRALSAPA